MFPRSTNGGGGPLCAPVLLLVCAVLVLGAGGCFTCGFESAICGNQICEAGEETCFSCPVDCRCSVCGDDVCSPDEDCFTCNVDCGICEPCGDGFCDPGLEDCESCPADCMKCMGVCGDMVCEPSECFSCNIDCAGLCGVCGDGFCDPAASEDCASCSTDCGLCGPVCGNNTCEMGESCASCPSDCACSDPGLHELFGPGVLDLGGASLRFTPSLTGGYFMVSACSPALEVLPGSGSASWMFTPGNDDTMMWMLPFLFEFFGTANTTVWIGSNGYLTFDVGDVSNSATVMNHYAEARIAPLLRDLMPSELIVDELPGRIAFTWREQTAPVTFAELQVVLESSGVVIMSYSEEAMMLPGGIAGLSSGSGGTGTAVDLSAGTCGLPYASPGLYQHFSTLNNDLDGAQITYLYTPSGYVYYTTVGHTVLQEGTGGGTLQSINLDLGDDETLEIPLLMPLPFWGQFRSTLWVSSNGYVTFDAADTGYSESALVHFNQVRLSLLFDDLDPFGVGDIYFDEYPDRAVVTYLNIPQYGEIDSNSFQAVIHDDGTIVVTYLMIGAADGLAGVSDGNPLGLPLPGPVNLVP